MVMLILMLKLMLIADADADYDADAVASLMKFLSNFPERCDKLQWDVAWCRTMFISKVEGS